MYGVVYWLLLSIRTEIKINTDMSIVLFILLCLGLTGSEGRTELETETASPVNCAIIQNMHITASVAVHNYSAAAIFHLNFCTKAGTTNPSYNLTQ